MLQALGVPRPAAADRLAMALAQVSIGDPVVMHPGVYIVHGQVVADGMHAGAVIAPIVTHGAITTPRVDLDHAVGDDLAVDDVDARMHHHRVADRHLGQRHRQPVGQPREHGDAERLQSCLGPVQGLGQERVAGPRQPQDLRDRVEPGAELVALAAVHRGHPGVRQQRLAHAGVPRADFPPHGVAQFALGPRVAHDPPNAQIVARPGVASWTCQGANDRSGAILDRGRVPRL